MKADVAICGGGLAGLALARQLKRALPELSIAVIDRLARPLPEAAHKVGESSTEIGSFYLTNVLGLSDYFRRTHLAKLGFRFFFRSQSGRFEDRPELGLVEFPAVGSYNFDRGILENDLRRFVAEDGVALFEDCSIRDVTLGSDGQPHEISYAGAADGSPGSITASWVVDATGRSRLLQRKLELTRQHGAQSCAAWFRLDGRIDVCDLVPREREAWHARVPNDDRYYSTNHLMGYGYWVWLIPLPSGTTSIGIVALEDVHPFSGLTTYARASRWLEAHEPVLAAHLEGREPLDFQCLRNYSYSSRQVFSLDRWACVGEAAVFPDPFYAPGTDILGFANCAVTELIRLDRRGELTAPIVKYFNRSILGLNDALTDNIQRVYRLFDNPLVTAAKVVWDTATAWGLLAPRMFNGTFVDRELAARVQKVTARSFFLTQRMQALFCDWSGKSSGRCSFEFIDFLSISALRELRARNLHTGKSPDELIDDHVANMRTLEELAQVLFLLAVEDVMPERLADFAPATWLNPWGVSLHPEQWRADGLFEPRSEPRPDALDRARTEIRGLLRMEGV